MIPRTDLRLALILPFSSPEAVLERAGGKGANLSRMARAGFPVPDGFLVTTAAYRAFIEENGLESEIEESLAQLTQANGAASAQALEHVSQRIRDAFTRSPIPAGIAAALRADYAALGAGPVAVRSSATAEDLPEMSFAGQQDTYLNVQGEAALLEAVVQCWGSLWTARAIGYRSRNGVPHQTAALAVVVQRMLQSQVSGVLFTANPLTGLRSQTVIDATLGLGEALVSGQVEPDHYVVDTRRGVILTRTLGAKTVSIRGIKGGGTRLVQEQAAAQQALPDDQILELARLGQQVAQAYDNEPQDIEWAWAENRLWLLQTRPVTSLYPTLEGVPAEPLKVMFSFAAVQGMLDPITPLGRDVIYLIFATGSRMMFHRPVAIVNQTALYPAGERLWGNITSLSRNTVGRRIVRWAVAFVDPPTSQPLDGILQDPRLQPEQSGIRPRTLLRLARFFGPIGWNIALNLMRPDARREMILASAEKTLEELRERAAAITGSPHEKLLQRVDLLPAFALENLPRRFQQFIAGVASGVASLNLLDMLTRGLVKPDGSTHGWHRLTLKMTRGLPNNPTTEMDLALWQVARVIRSDPQALAIFQAEEARSLARRYQDGRLPLSVKASLDAFLDRYGGRGLAEIDTGRERWAEDPTHIMESLGSYLKIEDESRAPDVVFQQGALEAQAAVEELLHLSRSSKHAWLRTRLVRFFASRVRALVSLRESPKFFAVRMMAVLRNSLLESGHELVAAGELDRPDDLFYLTLNEMRALSRGEDRAWKDLITERRQRYQRELLRRQIPRLLLSDGRAIYGGIGAQESGTGQITGSPVSPGNVEGLVRVVLDPRQANLQPGEIMVCPGTDPSWTPLFLIAAGLIMEVGGMMTHGAVVAREYGLPAIVGVEQVTQRLVTGQRVRMDGSTGLIQLLDEAEA